jgi:hypothetical protein
MIKLAPHAKSDTLTDASQELHGLFQHSRVGKAFSAGGLQSATELLWGYGSRDGK